MRGAANDISAAINPVVLGKRQANSGGMWRTVGRIIGDEAVLEFYSPGIRNCESAALPVMPIFRSNENVVGDSAMAKKNVVRFRYKDGRRAGVPGKRAIIHGGIGLFAQQQPATRIGVKKAAAE